MADLKSIMNEFMAVQGIKAALVVGRDGFVIESALGSKGAVDADAVAAVISSGIGSSEVIGRELSIGKLEQAMYEYKDGMLITSLLGLEAILAIVADGNSNLGNIRYQVKKRMGELVASL
jgi:predicted regulator of Ras-like GTPase activity (Roadblock/LC7/MglB family)